MWKKGFGRWSRHSCLRPDVPYSTAPNCLWQERLPPWWCFCSFLQSRGSSSSPVVLRVSSRQEKENKLFLCLDLHKSFRTLLKCTSGTVIETITKIYEEESFSMMKKKSVGFGFRFQTPRPISFILWVNCCFDVITWSGALGTTMQIGMVESAFAEIIGKTRLPVVLEHLQLPPISCPNHLFFTFVILSSFSEMLKGMIVPSLGSWEQ